MERDMDQEQLAILARQVASLKQRMSVMNSIVAVAAGFLAGQFAWSLLESWGGWRWLAIVIGLLIAGTVSSMARSDSSERV
jgi:MFS family permease